MSHPTGNQGPYGGNQNPAERPDRKRGPTGGNNRGGGGGGGRTCHKCGKSGHYISNCPLWKSGARPSGEVRQEHPEGSYVSGASGDHGSTAALPPISVETKAEIEKENTIVRNFGGTTRTAVPKPYRPSYGTKGDAVEFQTNYFLVMMPQELVLHRYNIKINVRLDKEGKMLPEPKNKKLKQIFRILLRDLESSNLKLPIATDFKSTLICSREIPQEMWGPEIKYYHEDDNGPGNNPPTYQLHIEETLPPLKVPVLRNFLASTEIVAQYEHRESMLQALNILLGHHSKSTRTTTMVGGNRAFPNTASTEKSPLTAGLEAIRGYFLSVRLASSRTLVNVNVSHGAFYEPIKLQDLIETWWTWWTKNNKVPEADPWAKLETFLKGLKVRTNYLKDENRNQITKVQSIKGFASPRDGGAKNPPPYVKEFAAAPSNVWFYFDEKRDFTKQEHKLRVNGVIRDKYISVNEFFESKRMIRSDPHERYPVVNFGSRGDPRYVPAEACTVEPGQLAKLTPDQTDLMIKFAVRDPDQNASSIKNNGLRALGLSPPGRKLTQFDVGIAPKMITVYGRMLNTPSVLYYGDISAMPAAGGWNLKGVKFRIRVPREADNKLNNWGCLRLHKPSTKSRSGAYGSAISGFVTNLESCGIGTREPWSEVLDYNKEEGDYFHSRTRRSMQKMIQAAHREGKNKILLIVLPSKDIALYNRIKRYCDLTEGIHTVCVVGEGKGKFYNCSSTYLANVALKFNLKLEGTNHTLNDVDMGIVSQGKTMVVGIDVVHPSPGSEKASVASMVASINKDLAQWPVDLQVQVRKGQEMLDKIDQMLESRLALWEKHHKVYPENILVYRDGVSESQYQKVLDQELKRMQNEGQRIYSEAGQSPPRFTLIIVGKRHHTRFFPPKNHPASDKKGNPNRGLVVDRGITEARNWDFFLQSHNAIQGTARPAHYYVLWDEIFTNSQLESVHQAIQPNVQPTDRLERLTYSLCYLFSRAAKAVSIPAPVYYADIACERAGRYLADTTTDSESARTDGMKMTDGQRDKLRRDLQDKIAVHKNLKNSMFYI